MKNLKVIIVDDSETYRENLKNILVHEYECEVIAEASNGDEFLNTTKPYLADIIFMDLCMPNINGWEATKKFSFEYPYSKVIAVTMFSNQAYLQQLVEVGFKGCILKNEVMNHLKQAIKTVMSGKFYFPKNLSLD